MRVQKRSGELHPVDFNKILSRINIIAQKAKLSLDTAKIAQSTIERLKDGISTSSLDVLTADNIQPLAVDDPQYGTLAAQILISDHHKNVIYRLLANFRHAQPDLTYHDIKNNLYYWVRRALIENVADSGSSANLVHPSLRQAPIQEAWFDYSRDFSYDYSGFKLLQKSYLMQASLLDAQGKRYRAIVEYPQHMIMRVAAAIHLTQNIDPEHNMEPVLSAAEVESRMAGITPWNYPESRLIRTQQTYDECSRMLYTHATPTLFNAGMRCMQLSSCFLQEVSGDSIDGIGDWIKESMQISKQSGGVASHISGVRARGSYIAGTNGTSSGICGWIQIAGQVRKTVDQGGDKRPGTHVVYLEPWHPDIFDFLNMRKDSGGKERKEQDMFYGLWISDEFMRRVLADQDYYLMCPNTCPGLAETCGQAHSELYNSYIAAGKYRDKVRAQDLWTAIMLAVIETSMPYMLFKDNANKLSNQQNLGTIRSSNLCAEIIEYSDEHETAVCNLASICLPKYVRAVDPVRDATAPDYLLSANGKLIFDRDLLHNTVINIVDNLDRVITINYYPNAKTKLSNTRHRPTGLGVQGLADLYTIMGYAFKSAAANRLQFYVFEAIHYAAITSSNILAQTSGAYSTIAGSPIANGQFHHELYQMHGYKLAHPISRDWESLRVAVLQHGVRNSLLTAVMPTASTSTIMGMSPCFEPHNFLVYKKQNRSEESIAYNVHFINDMIARGLWNSELKNAIMLDKNCGVGSTNLSQEIKELYAGAYDLMPSDVIKSAIVRAPWIDQSQSMNLFIASPSVEQLTKCYVFAHKNGLITGSYYVRGFSAKEAQKLQVPTAVVGEVCTRDNPDCTSCGS